MTQPPGVGSPGGGEGLTVRLRVVGASGADDVTVTAQRDATVRQVTALLPTLADRTSPPGSTEGASGRSDSLTDAEGSVLPPHAAWFDVAPPDGSTVYLVDHDPGRNQTTHSRYELAIVSGPHAGSRFPLTTARVSLGRGSDASVRVPDPWLSRRHVDIFLDGDQVTITNLSTNGTLIDGRRLDAAHPLQDGQYFTAGASVYTVRRAAPRHAATRRAPGTSRRIIQTPPRTAQPPPEPPVFVVPQPPAETSKPKLSIIAIVLPLVAAAAMVWLTQQPVYLLLAGMSPILAISAFWTARRTARRSSSEASTAYRAALTQHYQDVDVARAAATHHRRASVPDLAHWHAAATGPTGLLWQRTPGDADFLQLRLGTAAGPVPVVLRQPSGAIQPAPVGSDLPVTVTLTGTPLLGICGAPESRDGAIRAIVAQLCAAQSPQDLDVHILTSRGREPLWDTLKWFPHTEPHPLILNPPSSSTLLATVLAGPASHHVLIVDTVGDNEDHPVEPGLIAHAGERLHIIRLAESFDALPRPYRTSVELPDRTSTDACLHQPEQADQLFRPDLLDAYTLDTMSRAMAGLIEPAARPTPTTGTGLPDQIGYLESLGYPDLTPAALAQRWATAAGTPPVGVLGTGDDARPVAVDLRTGVDGPNSFLGGTVGSGKSDCLRGFLASLALTCSPQALNMVLIDFKGGSGLRVLQPLPHVSAFVTEADEHQMPRILNVLAAERTRRQQALDHLHYDSFDLAQAARGADMPFPRLLVVIDELAVLRERVPDAMNELVRIVRVGRSAGMHLLLCTQTISTTITKDLNDNTTLRVCLRVQDEAESRQVIGSPAAAKIQPSTPGRGYATSGNTTRAFQSGWIAARSTRDPSQPVTVQRFTAHPSITTDTSDAAAGPTDLDRLIHATQAAATHHHGTPPTPLIPDPLPTLLPLPPTDTTPTPNAAEPHTDDGSAKEPLIVPWGVIDRPSHRRVDPWSINFGDHGNVAIVGAPRSGRTTALRTLAISASHHPQPPHIYVIDSASRSLADLASFPNVGAVVAADDDERLSRLLAVLERELADRQDRGPEHRRDTILVLIDRFESLRDDSLEQPGQLSVIAGVTRLLREGPTVGIHLALSTDASALRTKIIDLLPARVVLNLNSIEDYLDAGLPRGTTPTQPQPPGRGLWQPDGDTVHLYTASATTGPPTSPPNRPATRVPAWADRYALTDLSPAPPTPAFPAEPDTLLIGVAAPDLTPLSIPWSSVQPGLLIVGGPRSGRTNYLTTLLPAFAALPEEPPQRVHQRRVLVVAGRGGRVANIAKASGAQVVLSGLDEARRLPALLAESAEPALVLIDDAHELQSQGQTLLDATVAAARAGHRLAITTTATDYSLTGSAWFKALRGSGTQLILRPPPRHDATSWAQLGNPPPPPHPPSRPGRGLLQHDGTAVWVQTPAANPG